MVAWRTQCGEREEGRGEGGLLEGSRGGEERKEGGRERWGGKKNKNERKEKWSKIFFKNGAEQQKKDREV